MLVNGRRALEKAVLAMQYFITVHCDLEEMPLYLVDFFSICSNFLISDGNKPKKLLSFT